MQNDRSSILIQKSVKFIWRKKNKKNNSKKQSVHELTSNRNCVLAQQRSWCQRGAAAPSHRLPPLLRRIRLHWLSAAGGHTRRNALRTPTCLYKPKVRLKSCFSSHAAAPWFILNKSYTGFGAERTRRARRAQRGGGRSAELQPAARGSSLGYLPQLSQLAHVYFIKSHRYFLFYTDKIFYKF